MNDFDFLVGEWTITNRRLRERLVGSDDWEEFASTSVVHNLFDGAANVDEITFPSKGFKGLTLRLFDPEREEWSLYWANSQTGVLFPPVVGRFRGRARRVLRRRRREPHPGPRSLHLVRDHPDVGPLGAGLLDRPGQDLGDELDHGAHPPDAPSQPPSSQGDAISWVNRARRYHHRVHPNAWVQRPAADVEPMVPDELAKDVRVLWEVLLRQRRHDTSRIWHRHIQPRTPIDCELATDPAVLDEAGFLGRDGHVHPEPTPVEPAVRCKLGQALKRGRSEERRVGKECRSR